MPEMRWKMSQPPRLVWQQISTHVNEGPSGGSSVLRPGSGTPISVSINCNNNILKKSSKVNNPMISKYSKTNILSNTWHNLWRKFITRIPKMWLAQLSPSSEECKHCYKVSEVNISVLYFNIWYNLFLNWIRITLN